MAKRIDSENPPNHWNLRPVQENLMLYIAIGIYTIAMTLANLSVVAFGPAISPINAFLFIGL